MKKGLLIYKAKTPYKNMGDYIQSLAAEQYTGRDVVFVEREHLHEYSGDPIKLIMNGWYMHIPTNWPPSKDIVPLLTSIHISPSTGEHMLNENGIEFFKKFGPVGCRDWGTEKLLKSKSIPAYFSGCLTLTLGKTYKHNPKSENVRFVDPYYEKKRTPIGVLNYLFTVLSKRKTIIKISSKLNKTNSFKKLLRTAAFYKAYSGVFEDEVLENADYLTHRILESTLETEEIKFDYARKLLQKYADSRLVVTSRIHVALPCVAMGTPAIFVVSEGVQPDAKGRFEGIIEFFNVLEYLNFKLKPILGFKVDKKIGINHSISNKQNHLKVAEELDKKCKSFINNPQEFLNKFWSETLKTENTENRLEK